MVGFAVSIARRTRFFIMQPINGLHFTNLRGDIIIDTIDAGRDIFLVGAQPDICQMLKNQQVTRHVEAGNMYQHRLDALHHASNMLSEAA